MSADFARVLFVFEVPECYLMFLLAVPESDEERFVVPVFSQPELELCQGRRVTPERLVKALESENGVCGASLGGSGSTGDGLR